MRGVKNDAHLDHVVAVLVEEFGWDDMTRGICRSSLSKTSYPNGYPPWFEFICDEPVGSANWRLKPDRESGKWGLRVAYYGSNHRMGQSRADDITRRLTEV